MFKDFLIFDLPYCVVGILTHCVYAGVIGVAKAIFKLFILHCDCLCCEIVLIATMRMLILKHFSDEVLRGVLMSR